VADSPSSRTAFATSLGIDCTRTNVLEIERGPNCAQLTGRMLDQPWGDICDGEEKRRMLLETCAHINISPRQAIAMGDGANDLTDDACLFRSRRPCRWPITPNPPCVSRRMVAINSGGLDRLLEVLR
jgi:phosphoserine phosphatase